MSRDGVADTSLRTVAAEAEVPLGTLQHAFRSKRQLLQAVVEDVNDEIARILGASPPSDDGLEMAIRRNLTAFWASLVTGHSQLQLMQYELTTHALRSTDQEQLADWQYRRYSENVASWCRDAAERAGETCAVSFEQLARLIVAGLDGLILQHLCDPNDLRSTQDLRALIDMLVVFAGIGRATST